VPAAAAVLLPEAGEGSGVREQQRRQAQHATQDERDREARLARGGVFPGKQQRRRPLDREQDPECAMRAHGELRHDFVTHVTGTSLAQR